MHIRPLIPELAEKARVELNEDPKRIESDLQHIKEWLSKQSHLRARTDDQWLLAFLRACKHSLERTKEKLDLYYSMRTLAPEFFSLKITEDAFNQILESGAIVILPKLSSPDGERVVIYRPGLIDAENYKITDFIGVSNAMQRILLVEDDNTVVSGIRTIMDWEGLSMSFFLQVTPSLMKKMAVFSQDASPLRFKGGHYVNVGGGFEKIFNAMKVFLNEKTKSRLYVHNKNFDELYKTIPKEILPVEYGGNGGTIPEITAAWKKKLLEYKDWLAEEESFGSDESKRPGKPKTAEEMFGVEGSFRQLEFD
ncbi:alpha-tocopherol transfer protein-like [Leptidea sinapis]|uniref:alpha-tocopherol transfer protein-like n=1 Tax=Leptidea sinapis TaxID=189913 RepID=UPI00212AEA82|nr:alpha-tocopherol transfer protein-like [Leptidea sinapis]